MKQEKINEWLEAEVTAYFLKLLEEKLDATFRRRAEVFHPGEPHKTQESKAFLLGEESALDDVIAAMKEKDFSQLEESDEERVRHTPLRGPGTHQAR